MARLKPRVPLSPHIAPPRMAPFSLVCAAGVVLEQTNSFSPIFYLTGVLYLSSFVLWATRMRSLPLLIRAPKPEGGERSYRTAR